jgi:hypothetical protein
MDYRLAQTEPPRDVRDPRAGVVVGHRQQHVGNPFRTLRPAIRLYVV